MSTAGAQTVSCYSFRLSQACACAGATSDSSCGPAFAVAVAANGAAGVCPPAGTITAVGPCVDDGSITVRSGCTVEHLQTKVAASCMTFCNGCGAQAVAWTNNVQQHITHINVIVCCTS